MKSAIIALCIVASVYAASVDQAASVVRSTYDLAADGNYAYGYETDNGIQGQASGTLKNVGKDEAALTSQGSYSYVGEGGQVYSITYIADENGYQPQGAHLPTPPAPEPIPEYIAKSLAYIAAHPYVEKKQ